MNQVQRQPKLPDVASPPSSDSMLLADSGLVGRSDAMRALLDVLTKAAESGVTVLLTGESGTGKELVARVLHQRSDRRDGPFIAINCAAVPETLLESELFGHVQGAFTHASKDKIGLIERANGGTLFLDEIADTSMEVQAKLLRVLQERRVRPVGATEERDVDVRLLAASNRRLQDEVKDGRFREDLYFRVNVMEVIVPPLRERGDDVLLIAEHFLAELMPCRGRVVRGFDDEATAALYAYGWPGNVRELHNCVQRAVTLADEDIVRLEDLPPEVLGAEEQRVTLPGGVVGRESLPRLSVIERRYIRRVLAETAGNKTRAAQVLGIDRRTLHRKLRRMETSANDTEQG